jgi:hypothetical protein
VPTELEGTLAERAANGQELNLAGEEAVNEAAMRSWGAERTVSAAAIRDILCGRTSSSPSDGSYPGELKLRGARITGRIDLEHLRSRMGLDLADCFLAEGMTALDAELPALVLRNCVVEHRRDVPLDAPLLRVAYLDLGQTRIRGQCEGPAVFLMGRARSSS